MKKSRGLLAGLLRTLGWAGTKEKAASKDNKHASPEETMQKRVEHPGDTQEKTVPKDKPHARREAVTQELPPLEAVQPAVPKNRTVMNTWHPSRIEEMPDPKGYEYAVLENRTAKKACSGRCGGE